MATSSQPWSPKALSPSVSLSVDFSGASLLIAVALMALYSHLTRALSSGFGSAAVAGATAISAAEVRKAFTPMQTKDAASRATVANLSLLINMSFSTPSVRAAAVTETAPAAAAVPAANEVAALIVEAITEAGTSADAALSDKAAASAPTDNPNPCRESFL